MGKQIEALDVKAFRVAHDDAKQKGIIKGKGGQSSVKCPCCPDGFIDYSVASSNGHMWAKCSTKECVRWIE